MLRSSDLTAWAPARSGSGPFRLRPVPGSGPRQDRLECAVNGRPGLVARKDGVTVSVLAFDTAGDRIQHVWAVLNPDKLRLWTAR